MASDNLCYLMVSGHEESRHDLVGCPGLGTLKAVIQLLARDAFICWLERADCWQVSIPRAGGQTPPPLSYREARSRAVDIIRANRGVGKNMNKTEATVFLKLFSEVMSCLCCHVLCIRQHPAIIQGKGPHRSVKVRKVGSLVATVGAVHYPGRHGHCKSAKEAADKVRGEWPGPLLLPHTLIFYSGPHCRESLGHAALWATAEQDKGKDGVWEQTGDWSVWYPFRFPTLARETMQGDFI